MKTMKILKKMNVWYMLNVAVKILRKRRVLDSISALEPLKCVNSPRYIVSLTSYGKRLATTAPYAAATLLNQSVKPDKVILWAANEDRGNIPRVMGKLTEKGLEIRFCEDIKSYKKLIPAIENFPEDCIITADDDVFYPQNWLEQLLAEHRKHPKKIICHRAHGMKSDENHDPLPYNSWDESVEPDVYFARVSASRKQTTPYRLSGVLFPTGVAGALYPPRSLAEDATNKELFMKLAPKADDIWYWAMAVINTKYFGDENPYIAVKNSCTRKLWYVDLLNQLNGTALWNYNRLQGGNDIQLKAVMEHYPQIKERLRKIEPA